MLLCVAGNMHALPAQGRPHPLHSLLHFWKHLHLRQVCVCVCALCLLAGIIFTHDLVRQHHVSDGAHEAAEEDV